jgi:hypothetical protein
MSARYSMSCGKVSTGALTTGSTKTLVLLNPVTDGFNLIEAWLSFGAIASQSDIAAEIVRVVTIGSAAGTTGTVVKDDPNLASSTTTGLTALSTEPTTYEKLREFYVPVNQGLLVVQFPLGREPHAAAAGGRIGLRVINDEAGTMTAVNARCTLVWEEE